MATRTPRKGPISDELLAGQEAAEVFRIRRSLSPQGRVHLT